MTLERMRVAEARLTARNPSTVVVPEHPGRSRGAPPDGGDGTVIVPEHLSRSRVATLGVSSSYVAVAMILDAMSALAALAVGCSWLLGHSWNVSLAVGLGGAVAWVVALAFSGCYESKFLGIGPDELRRILRAVLWSWAILISLVFLTDVVLPREFVVSVLLAVGAFTAIGRLVLRQWLYAQRRRGKSLVNTLVIGSQSSIDRLAEVIDSNRVAGFRVVGAVRSPEVDLDCFDLKGWLDEVAGDIRTLDVRAVAVAHSATAVCAGLVDSLAWRLDGPGIDLLLESALEQAAGPRVKYRPAPGLPLFHLDEPYLIGTRRVLKRAMDIVLSAIGLVVLAPILALVAFLVRVTSRGPVFYTEYRIGQRGRRFRCSKFRTMVDGAAQQRAVVFGDASCASPEEYRGDPRITKLGKVLRRWSIDELPQLVNVLGGSMSLVGPRPIIADELPLLTDSDHRRHMTKPGLTGLWQVSGRKELHWDERMRLDLYYVENWSPVLDVLILFRTIKAVVTGHGAI